MRSIGNDIISLQLTNPERTKQERFYSKIICKQELELFEKFEQSIISFEKFIWLAWSIKESVYKFYKRNNCDAVFSPTKISIQKIHVPTNSFLLNNAEHEAISFADESCLCCEVSFYDQIFHTRSLLQNELIFTVANNSNNFENVYWGIKNIDNDAYENQSQNVRGFVINKLQSFFTASELSIEKTETGYPFLKQQKHLPISFTHHGKFVAYAFVK